MPQRDEKGRWLPQIFPEMRPDERMTNEEIYKRIQQDWQHLPHGAKKPYARELGLGFTTVQGIARGRAAVPARILRTVTPGRNAYESPGLPETCRRRASQALTRMARQERILARHDQDWPDGTPHYYFTNGDSARDGSAPDFSVSVSAFRARFPEDVSTGHPAGHSMGDVSDDVPSSD